MKKLNISTLCLLVLLLLGFTSCSTIKTLPNGKTIDKRLVGTWEGSEKDHQAKGISKEWEMIRKEDGTFVLNFKAITPEGAYNEVEEGTWWVNQNTFYEYHNYSDKTDTYNFQVLNKDEIKFKMLNSDVEFENSNYTFIDKRKKTTKTSKTTKRDGSSIEKAIKAKSVSDEYSYIRENCKGCTVVSQALMSKGKKPYDRIHVKTKEGKEKTYFFDISSFFGNFK